MEIGSSCREKKIKSVVNNSAEVAKNYVDQTRNSIEADISLMVLDINSKANMFYENDGDGTFTKITSGA